MADKDHPIPKKEFDAIFAKVPRLTVEVIVKNSDGAIYLAKRAIEPCKGQWHLPGGTVRFGERLLEAVKRVAQFELHIEVEEASLKGYIEYPSHYEHGLDSPVGIVFEVTQYRGELKPNYEASNGEWFRKMPHPMHADQDAFLLEHGYLTEE
jgi:ADP-ribose pyrophosphatase YjhB (NUDIX family)